MKWFERLTDKTKSFLFVAFMLSAFVCTVAAIKVSDRLFQSKVRRLTVEERGEQAAKIHKQFWTGYIRGLVSK